MLQEEIANENYKILELQSQLAQIKDAQKNAEVKLRQELINKELALAQVEEERRLKDATEVDSKRKLEALQLKFEIDFQHQKDDLQRLEQEKSRLKASIETAEVQSNTIQCMICLKDEVSIVFLPCAHQVLCSNCNENYGREERAICPCCWAPIEERIRVYY